MIGDVEFVELNTGLHQCTGFDVAPNKTGPIVPLRLAWGARSKHRRGRNNTRFLSNSSRYQRPIINCVVLVGGDCGREHRK